MANPIAIVAYLALFGGLAFVFLLVNLCLGKLVRPDEPNEEKLAVYECGEPTIGSAFVQFDLRFYVVALLFLIFDVEVAFFFPWANVYGTANALRASVAEETMSAEAAGLFHRLGAEVPTLAEGQTPTMLAAEVETAAKQLALASICDIGVFFAVLVVGFAYVWSRGDIDWVRAVQERKKPDIARRRAPTLPVEHEPELAASS